MTPSHRRSVKQTLRYIARLSIGFALYSSLAHCDGHLVYDADESNDDTYGVYIKYSYVTCSLMKSCD